MKEIVEIQQSLTIAAAAARNSVKIDTDDVDAYMIALQAEESNSKTKSAAALRVLNFCKMLLKLHLWNMIIKILFVVTVEPTSARRDEVKGFT